MRDLSLWLDLEIQQGRTRTSQLDQMEGSSCHLGLDFSF